MTFALIKSKGKVTGDGRALTTRQLRDAIPAATILAMQVEVALTGKLRRIDMATGEEVEIAESVPLNERLKIMDKLVDKRLPSAKTEELSDQGRADLTDIPVDAEEIKRMPISQLGRVIEAQFEKTTSFTGEELYEAGIKERPRATDPVAAGEGGGAGAADRPAGEDVYENGDGE